MNLPNACRQYDCMTGREAWLEKMTSYFPDEQQVGRPSWNVQQQFVLSLRLCIMADG